jgi:hypothetical protein
MGTQILLSTINCYNDRKDGCQFLRHYIEASWDSNVNQNSTFEYSSIKHIPFRTYCDTFWDLFSKQDENITNYQTLWRCPQDQWQCSSRQCICFAWVLDGEWDCPDASDEVNIFGVNFNESHHNHRWIRDRSFQKNFIEKYRQLSFGEMCNSSTEYPCLTINMSHYSNDSRFCIDLKFIGDGRIDCMGGYDERSTINHCNQFSALGYHYKCLSTNTYIPYSFLCTLEHRCPNRSDDELWCRNYDDSSLLMQFMCKNGTVIGNGRCNGKYECIYGEDEYMCHQVVFIERKNSFMAEQSNTIFDYRDFLSIKMHHWVRTYIQRLQVALLIFPLLKIGHPFPIGVTVV